MEPALSGPPSPDARRTYFGQGCSLTACPDRALELSPLFGRPLVKALPQSSLLPTLRAHKGQLQTAGLLCPDRDRPTLTQLLLRSGVTRVLRAGAMSDTFCGEAHDGEYPLRRYIRMVNIQP